MKHIKNVIFLAIFLFVSESFNAQTVYQWRGENRDGVYIEKDLLREWPKDGPELLWSIKDLGKGYASVTVTDDAVFVTGMKDSSDYLTKLTLDGKQIWQKKYGDSWYKTFPDTRGTPTIENGNVYLISGNGTIACIDSDSGKINWSFNAYEKYKGAYGEWGVCESLLITDDKLIYTPGGDLTTMVALDKTNGNEIWKTKSLEDKTAYVSPILFEYAGKKIIVNVLATYILAVNAENGEILWRKNYSEINSEISRKMFESAPYINTNSPIYYDGQLYITSGYNHTGVMFKLNDDGTDAEQLWADSVLDVHHGGAVLINGFLYGANWINNKSGEWCCIDWNTGEKKYSQEWKNKGSIVSADGLLFCFEEKSGFIGLAEANPDEFEIISSFKVPFGTGPYWSHPVIDKGILYVRHGDALMAYKIK